METGKITVYYGKGVGKTSAAIGSAIKAATAGETAYMVQFLKGQLSSKMFDRLEPEIKVFRFEHNEEGYNDLSSEEKREELQNYTTALNFAKKVLSTGECDLLVLDEVLGVVAQDIVTSGELLDVLAARRPFTNVILTGNDLPDAIRVAADVVYNIVPEK